MYQSTGRLVYLTSLSIRGQFGPILKFFEKPHISGQFVRTPQRWCIVACSRRAKWCLISLILSGRATAASFELRKLLLIEHVLNWVTPSHLVRHSFVYNCRLWIRVPLFMLHSFPRPCSASATARGRVSDHPTSHSASSCGDPNASGSERKTLSSLDNRLPDERSR